MKSIRLLGGAHLVFCATDEIAEHWNVGYYWLIGEGHGEEVERGVNSGHDISQVRAIAVEVKVCESGEDDARELGGASTCSVGPILRGFEIKVK